MSVDKRLSVDEVKKAYKRTEYTPRSKLWIDNSSKCACAFGAMILDKKPELKNKRDFDLDKMNFESLVSGLLGVSSDYVGWYISGFDGELEQPSTPQQKQAYEDGIQARKEILGYD